MSRRQFLKTMLPQRVHYKAGGGSQISASVALQPSPRVAYISESGLQGFDDVVVTGLIGLRGPDIQQIGVYISDLRLRHDYRQRLSFKSSNRFKIPFAKSLIDYFISNDKFSLLIHVQEQESDAGDAPTGFQVNNRLSGRGNSMVHLFQQVNQILPLQAGQVNNAQPATVFMKHESPFNPQASYSNGIRQTHNWDFVAADSRENELLQMADLLTGCVALDHKKSSCGDATKLEILNHLRLQLGVDKLSAENFHGSRKIIFV